jgi:hypothetical protein
MQIDVNQTLQLRRSGSAVLVGILILIFLFGVSLMVALTDDEAMKRYFGWGGVLLFGAGLVSAAWRSRDPTGPLVTLGPQGICCSRVSPKFVPWSAVEGWSVRRARRNTPDVLVIKLSGTDLDELASTHANPWGRPANPLVGVHELRIMPAELGMKADDLLQTISVYADAHRRKTA